MPDSPYTGDEKPWICVCGPHSSGTRIHTELVNELNEANNKPFFVQHHSFPMAKFPEHDYYVFVQRDPRVTALSQRVRGYGVRAAASRGEEFEGFESQVWSGIAQAAEFFRRPECNGRVLHVWYGETVQNPLRFAERVRDFIQTEDGKPYFPQIPVQFGHQITDMSAKYVPEASRPGVIH